MAVPHYDQGKALNMVVLMREDAGCVRSGNGFRNGSGSAACLAAQRITWS